MEGAGLRRGPSPTPRGGPPSARGEALPPSAPYTFPANFKYLGQYLSEVPLTLAPFCPQGDDGTGEEWVKLLGALRALWGQLPFPEVKGVG